MARRVQGLDFDVLPNGKSLVMGRGLGDVGAVPAADNREFGGELREEDFVASGVVTVAICWGLVDAGGL